MICYNNICMSYGFIFILISINILITLLIINISKESINNKCLDTINLINKNNTNNLINENNKNYLIDENNKFNYLKVRDESVLYNDFTPPERRLPYNAYPFNYLKNIINIPTRGYPDNYQLMGIVMRENTETAFNLFGRQKYPGSNQYEYYIESVLHNNKIKIPLEINGDKEIENNQIITIPGIDKTKGDFIVKLYNYDMPRYNQYI